jgi:hypothetical protein
MDRNTVLVLAVAGGVVGIIALASLNSSGGGGAVATIAGDASDAGQNILSALSSFENVATSHNNPGGICGSFDGSGNCLGPATFPSLDAGIAAGAAAVDRILQNNPGITLADFIAKWSGATGQVLQNYITSVSDSLGLDPSDPISAAGGNLGE